MPAGKKFTSRKYFNTEIYFTARVNFKLKLYFNAQAYFSLRIQFIAIIHFIARTNFTLNDTVFHCLDPDMLHYMHNSTQETATSPIFFEHFRSRKFARVGGILPPFWGRRPQKVGLRATKARGIRKNLPFSGGGREIRRSQVGWPKILVKILDDLGFDLWTAF